MYFCGWPQSQYFVPCWVVVENRMGFVPTYLQGQCVTMGYPILDLDFFFSLSVQELSLSECIAL